MQSVVFKEPPVTAAPDVLEMSIEPTDEFLIVASDGLWEVKGPPNSPLESNRGSSENSLSRRFAGA